MTAPLMCYRNNDLAAHAVYDHIRDSGLSRRRLSLRPYNRFDTKFTEWWLIPGTEWPAYRYGKLFFSQSVTDLMFTGLNMEKGLGQQLSGLAKNNQLLGADWFWHEFLKAILDGALDAPLHTIQERAGMGLRVYVNIYEFNHAPDPETGENAPDDELAFSIGEGDLKFTQTLEGEGLLAPLNGAANLQDLSMRFTQLENIHWYWSNWLIGARVRYSADDTGDWNAADLWHRLLEPWLPWVQ